MKTKFFYQTSHEECNVFRNHNFSFPTHLHKELELIYVEQGQLTITIHENTKTIVAGDCALAFPNIMHSYSQQGECSSDFSGILCICNSTLLGEFASIVKHRYPENPFLSHKDLHPNVGYAFQELLHEFQTQRSTSIYSALLQLILARTIPLCTLQKSSDNNDANLTYRIAAYLIDHYKEEIGLSSLAKHLNVSMYYVSHIFSSQFNVGFTHYLNHLRLNHAISLLHNRDLSVLEIALESGFGSQRTFNRVFYNSYQISPREYRKLYT